EEVEILKGVPIFAKMELAKIKLIAFTGERMNYTEGQELCHQGDPGDAMYVILEGVAEVLIDTPPSPIQLAELPQNNFFGDTAIMCDATRNATIKAREPLITVKISRDMFYRLVAEVPQMAIEIMRELVTRVHDANKKLEEVTAANKAA